MTTGQLRALTTNVSVEAAVKNTLVSQSTSMKKRKNILRQALNEREDVRIPASLLKLLLSDLLVGFRGTEQDVEADGTGIECLQVHC